MKPSQFQISPREPIEWDSALIFALAGAVNHCECKWDVRCCEQAALNCNYSPYTKFNQLWFLPPPVVRLHGDGIKYSPKCCHRVFGLNQLHINFIVIYPNDLLLHLNLYEFLVVHCSESLKMYLISCFSFFVLVEPDEWKFLAQHFIFDYKITLYTSEDANEPDEVNPGEIFSANFCVDFSAVYKEK